MEEPPPLLDRERRPRFQEVALCELACERALVAKLGERLARLVERTLAGINAFEELRPRRGRS